MLQDQFLQRLVQGATPVTIYLVNGIRLQGEIGSYDQYVLMLLGSSQQLVYKHAISTIVPMAEPQPVSRPGEAAVRAEAPAPEIRRRRTRTLPPPDPER